MSRHLHFSLLDDVEGLPMNLSPDDDVLDERSALGDELFAAENLPQGWLQVAMTLKTRNPEHAQAMREWETTLQQATLGMAFQAVQASSPGLTDEQAQQAAQQLLSNSQEAQQLRQLAEQQLGGPPDVEPFRLREVICHYQPKHLYAVLRALPGVGGLAGSDDLFTAAATELGIERVAPESLPSAQGKAQPAQPAQVVQQPQAAAPAQHVHQTPEQIARQAVQAQPAPAPAPAPVPAVTPTPTAPVAAPTATPTPTPTSPTPAAPALGPVVVPPSEMKDPFSQ